MCLRNVIKVLVLFSTHPNQTKHIQHICKHEKLPVAVFPSSILFTEHGSFAFCCCLCRACWTLSLLAAGAAVVCALCFRVCTGMYLLSTAAGNYGGLQEHWEKKKWQQQNQQQHSIKANSKAARKARVSLRLSWLTRSTWTRQRRRRLSTSNEISRTRYNLCANFKLSRVNRVVYNNYSLYAMRWHRKRHLHRRRTTTTLLPRGQTFVLCMCAIFGICATWGIFCRYGHWDFRALSFLCVFVSVGVVAWLRARLIGYYCGLDTLNTFAKIMQTTMCWCCKRQIIHT